MATHSFAAALRGRLVMPLFVVALSASSAHAGGTAVDALVDRVLAAHGGREALAKARAYRMEGTVTSVMRGTGATVRTFERPDRLRIVIDYPGRLETRILDKGRGWRSNPDGTLTAADDFLLTSMVLQAARANLPWILDERRAELVPLAPMDGGQLQGLELPLGQGLRLTVYVESGTGRIARSAGVLASPSMTTNFATDYADFRTVDGVLFPFREANFAANQSTGETVITKITVNPPLTDADFRP